MNKWLQKGFNALRRVLVTTCFCFATFVLASDDNTIPNRLNNIDFKINADKAAVIIIELDSASSVVDVAKTKNGLNIKLLNTLVSDDKLFVLDVSDFATVVDTIEVFRQQSNGLLEVKVKGDYQYDYQLNKNVLEVVIRKSEPQPKQDQKLLLEQDNKPISFNFQDIPVRNVLQLIADYNGFNLVVSDSVAGNMTLRLDGVPWQKALNIILEARGLDKRIDGNVILVAPKSELDLREQQELEKARMEEALGDLQSDIIKISFAKASDIAEMINGEGALTMLSERGSISIDERTNALLIRELPENIDVIRDIVKSLDVPVKQVQIEARIVTVNEGDLEELGVRWGFTSTNGSHTSGGSIESNLFVSDMYDSGDGEGGGSGKGMIPLDDFLNVNLAATTAGASSIAFQVAKLGDDTLLDLELSALQRESKAEIISSPRLITTNKKPAYIEQGTELPYLEASSSGATTVSFRKAVLSLMVTPQITPDNRLVLDLSVTQDRVGDVVKTGTGEAVAINTQRIGTQVLVNNGETVVLGGIFQHSLTRSVEKVPLLGDLPLLGALFRRSYEKMGKSELLIFVTPKVVIQ
ncbi:type IV pilus secretin PilQ [Vibrio diazotrophicus]|uniref:type IV pilus secretin PilQ n=1 Tax=Vibrio diazotrophicus TaxID=685 RepID=UPI00142DFB13|nr:type IV pilus secretin PilQ family protein [Vibrio diazotrophicus]NIY92789.1 type IV pilus secretin PilQ family protein [Vibrio diazotrophicus]